jgi:hypothetical protein
MQYFTSILMGVNDIVQKTCMMLGFPFSCMIVCNVALCKIVLALMLLLLNKCCCYQMFVLCKLLRILR